MQVTFFESQADFRQWLEHHHDNVSELIIGFYNKKSGKDGLTYKEAVDEALCFGWIDGVRRRIDDERYSNRFTPRKKQSNWSQVNIKRIAELNELGLVHPAGKKVFDDRVRRPETHYSYEGTRSLDPESEEVFRRNERAWAFYQTQPPSYRRMSAWWVLSAKRPETRLKRLNRLIADSETGVRSALFRRPGP